MTTVLDMPKTPDPRRSPLPYHIGLRMSPAHYGVLLSIAESEDVSLSEAARICIERAGRMTEGPAEGGNLWDFVNSPSVATHPDPEWSERHGDLRSSQEADTTGR